jgi:hypothetical protein
VDRIFVRSGRWIVRGALSVVAMAGLAPAAAASTWSPAARLTTSGAPFSALGVGAFAQPAGTFLLSGYSNFYSVATGAGNTTGAAGGAFSPPSGPVIADAVWLPDGSSLVAWSGSFVQQRAANGTLVGSPQTLAGNVGALGVDSSGNATAAGVLSSNGFTLNMYTRPASGSSFTESVPPLASTASNVLMTLIGLVVDPSGAAVVTWLEGGTIKQATRAAGASSFSAPAVVASNAFSGIGPNGVSFASNATGRAVLVYYDGTGYGAAIRDPGGSFPTPVDITGPLTSSALGSASAVSADGTAATLVAGSTPSGGGTSYSQHPYALAPGGTTWTAGAVLGGSDGDSVAHPALAGGPGSRIDAAWSVDTRSSLQEATGFDSYEILAGTLGGPMTTIFNGSPPTLSGSYGNGYTGGSTPAMALNSCGDGALIVGIADTSNTDTHDGLFTSTTTGGTCVAGGTKPANSSPPTVTGSAGVGQKLSASTGTWSGTAPIGYAYQWQRCTPACTNIAGAVASSYALVSADQGASVGVTVTASNAAGSAVASSAEVGPIGPSAAAIRTLLSKILAPKGKPAKLSAIRKRGGYSLTFTASSAGKLTVSWYAFRKGAHLAATKPQLVASGKASFSKPGKVTLLVKLSAKGKLLLKHSHKLKLTAKGSYTPTGGSAISAIKSFTLKG